MSDAITASAGSPATVLTASALAPTTNATTYIAATMAH